MEIDSPNPRPASLVDKMVVPGDVVLDLSRMTNQTIKLGSGLRQERDMLAAMEAGKLRFLKPNKYWIESSHKRYIPCVEAMILGIVVDSKPDNFLVDIKGPSLAFLPVLAFEGGTRRNIPKFEILKLVIKVLPIEQKHVDKITQTYALLELLKSQENKTSRLSHSYTSIAEKVGTLLYVRVVKTNGGMNPELACTDASGKAAEFGPLKEGYMFETSTGLSRMLLSSPTCPVLEALGKKLSFEIAVGLNGRVWVNASSPSTVILVSNAIMSSEFLSGVQQRIMVDKLLQRVEQ